MAAEIKTISFSESSEGWTSFWDYEPSSMFSLKGEYYTTNNGSIWRHYDVTTESNRGYFYGTYYPSTVTLIVNDGISEPKNFKTLNYEGSNGWEATSILGDEYSPTADRFTETENRDSAKPIKSYSEGSYIDFGVQYRVGFNIKNNKYFANLRNNSVIPREGEVSYGDKISGIKGLYMEVTLATDSSTRVGGKKQLFMVSSEYVQS